MTSIFEKYGRPMEITTDELGEWAKVLTTLIDQLNTESVSTAEFESKVRQELSNEEIREDLLALCDSFAHSVFAIIDDDPSAAVHTYELLRLFTGNVKDERDYHTRKLARLNKPRPAVGSDFTETKSDAEAIKAHVERVYDMLDMVHPGETWNVIRDADGNPILNEKNETVPVVPVKNLKDGSVKPDLPRIPGGPREGGGRKSATHNLRLIVDGVQYDQPIDSVLHDVLSVGANRVTLDDLKNAVEKSCQDFGKGWDAETDDDEVRLNDHLVGGIVVSVTEESDENEDSDSE